MASIFSKIIRGDMPSERVYETESELAFLDINPFSEGHTLVVPKREVPNFDGLSGEDLASLTATLQTVTRGVIRAMGTPHYNLSLNNGRPAGQLVDHVHFHIIPRFEDSARSWHRQNFSQEKMAQIGEKIRQALRELGFSDRLA